MDRADWGSRPNREGLVIIAAEVIDATMSAAGIGSGTTLAGAK